MRKKLKKNEIIYKFLVGMRNVDPIKKVGFRGEKSLTFQAFYAQRGIGKLTIH